MANAMILEKRTTYYAVRESVYQGSGTGVIPYERTYLFQTIAEAREMFPGVSNKWTDSTRIPARGERIWR